MNVLHSIPYYDNEFQRAIFLVLTDFTFTNYLKQKETIPQGFKYDGCSRPWFFEKYLPINSINNLAFAVHDWGYFIQDKSRLECDKQLLVDLLANPANSFTKCLSVYISLRLFGYKAWSQNQYIKQSIGHEYFIMAKDKVKQIIDDFAKPFVSLALS